MLDDEDFEFSDEDFAKDNQLTILDEARSKLLKNIEGFAKEGQNNLKYGEKYDFKATMNLISQNMSALISLDDIDENLPEEEVQERIDKIIKMTTELTFANIDDVLKNESEEEANTEVDSGSGSDDDTTDW